MMVLPCAWIASHYCSYPEQRGQSWTLGGHVLLAEFLKKRDRMHTGRKLRSQTQNVQYLSSHIRFRVPSKHCTRFDIEPAPFLLNINPKQASGL